MCGFDKPGGCVFREKLGAEGAVDKNGKTDGDENEGAGVERGGHFCGGGLQVGGEDGSWIGNESD